MRILLFRHGPAEARDARRWPDDIDRPLTTEGEGKTRRAARGIVALESPLTTVYTSPLRRALDTARLLTETAGLPETPRALEALAPGGSWRDVLRVLDGLAPNDVVALVGHEPELGKLCGVLLFGAPASLPLKKAGACSIEWSPKGGPGSGRLRWMMSARALGAFARARRHA